MPDEHPDQPPEPTAPDDWQLARATLQTQITALEGQLSELGQAAEAAAALARAAQHEGLGYLRRAILAEQSGRVVPELIAGDTPEALEASVEPARAAFERAAEAARRQLAATAVPVGAPARAGLPLDGLSSFAKIAEGLR